MTVETEPPPPTRLPRNSPSRQRCEDDARRIVRAADDILAQGEALLRIVSVANYIHRVPQAFNASIGGHYRHCLDHFSSILRGLEGREVNYDHRERDSRIELQPDFALTVTQRLRSQLQQLPLEQLEAPVQACCEVSYEPGEAPFTASTVGRELVYAIAHAIHHYALISVLSRLTDAPLPEPFGIAPSTVLHQRATEASRPGGTAVTTPTA